MSGTLHVQNKYPNLQCQYDLNGNMITDSVYNNFSISYDHRKLITVLNHIDTLTSTRQYSYATKYWYDEAGNIVRKLTYRNAQIPPPQINDWGNPGNGWTLLNNEHYVRGVDGKELATYTNNSLTEWYVWGSDMVGKIKGSAKYYFFKDHLGSVRAVVDNNFNLVSATDYDAWGDKMQGRIYNGDSTKFGFTGKEQDDENLYDYFGARYYDNRVGKWTSIDPQLSNNPSLTPYNYASDNPIARIDPSGLDDFYFMSDKTVKVSTDLADRYYVEHEKGIIKGQGSEVVENVKFFEANSLETVTLYEWHKIDLNFKEGKFEEAFMNSLPDALEEFAIKADLLPAEFYIYRESIKGKMDQKLRILRENGVLYLFDNIVYNRNEAANIVWGAVNAHLGISSSTLAQIYANIASLYMNRRPDEPWDQRAIQRGWYYYDSDFRRFYK